jgi:hypothetical protein
MKRLIVLASVCVAAAALFIVYRPSSPVTEVRALLAARGQILFDRDLESGGSDERRMHIFVMKAPRLVERDLYSQLMRTGWERLGEGLIHAKTDMCMSTYTGAEYSAPNLEFIPKSDARADLAVAIRRAGRSSLVISLSYC